MMSIHAFASISREQGRVDVDDAALEAVNEPGRDEQQEPGKHHMRNIVLIENGGSAGFIFPRRAGNDMTGNGMAFSYPNDTGFRMVGDDDGDPDSIVMGEMGADLIRIAAATGSEY